MGKGQTGREKGSHNMKQFADISTVNQHIDRQFFKSNYKATDDNWAVFALNIISGKHCNWHRESLDLSFLLLLLLLYIISLVTIRHKV